jgi:hypothetical protein
LSRGFERILPSGGGRNQNIGEIKPEIFGSRKDNPMNSFDMKFKRGKKHKGGRKGKR